MTEPNVDKHVVAVLFPGIIKNTDRAIEYLGGLKSIAEANNPEKKMRLGLSYHPENRLLSKIYADTVKTNGVLMKVKIKKKVVDGVVQKKVISSIPVAKVTKIFKFEGMADFQFLPLKEGAVGETHQCAVDDILPSGTEDASFLKKDAKPHIVPEYFTRLDKPFPYQYTDKKLATHINEDVFKLYKKTEKNHHVKFNLTDEFPTEPHERIVKRIEARCKLQPSFLNDINTLKKAFEERPIWILNGIIFATKIRRGILRMILPSVAFFLIYGPWHMVWVKFGYDPRKEPAARFYQTLDFRVRNTAGVNAMVQLGRKFQAKKASSVPSQSTAEEDDVPEGLAVFKPGILLTQRQVYYQYCDIQLDEVQRIVSAKPSSPLCHSTRGWLPANLPEVARDLIFKSVQQTMVALHSQTLKLEQASSSDDNDSEEEIENNSAMDIDDL